MYASGRRILTTRCIAGVPPPPKLPPFSLGDLGPQPSTRFLGRTRDHSPNNISIGSAVLAQLMVVTNRQTDTQTATQTTEHR